MQDIKTLMQQSREYSEYVHAIILMSAAELKQEVEALKSRRDMLNDTVVTTENVETLEKDVEDVQTKLRICRHIQPIVSALSPYNARPVRNTFSFLGSDGWAVKIVCHNNYGLALGESNTVHFYTLEQTRALKFYLNVHEDDFLR